MRGGRSPGNSPGRARGEVGSSPGKLKVYESKKERKRLRLSESESDSDDDLIFPGLTNRSRNGSLGQKTNRVDLHGVEGGNDVERKILKSDSIRIKEAGPRRRGFHDECGTSSSTWKRKLKSGLSETEEERISLSAAIKHYKGAKFDRRDTNRVMFGGKRDKSNDTDDYVSRRMRFENRKYKEEDDDMRVNRDLGGKRAMTTKRPRKDESECLKSSGDDGDCSLSSSQDLSVPRTSCHRVQGKGGVLRPMPNDRMPLVGSEKRQRQKDAGEIGKTCVPGGNSRQSALLPGGKKSNTKLVSPSRTLKKNVNSMNKGLPCRDGKEHLLETGNSLDAESTSGESSSSNAGEDIQGENSSVLSRSLLSKSTRKLKNGLQTEKLKTLVHKGREANGGTSFNIQKRKESITVFSSNGKRKFYDVENKEDNSSSETDLWCLDKAEADSKSKKSSGLSRGTNSGSIKTKGKAAEPSSSSLVGRQKKENWSLKGRQTEKQRIRDHIKNMLLDAGWTIDMRPRRGRTYNDHVYISPKGTEYWSITKAYDALEKQFAVPDNGEDDAGKNSAFSAIPRDILGMLTRKTMKKKLREEKEKKKKLTLEKGNKGAKQGDKTKTNKKGKVGSSVALEGKMPKLKFKEKGSVDVLEKTAGNDSDLSSSEQGNPMSTILKGTEKGARPRSTFWTSDTRKNKNQRGFALLVRSLKKGETWSSSGSFRYPSKLNVLSWLIDSGTVPENGKVQYMNKRHTRAMLDGWITREGIHCSCCSKILTISKFEIHAGSKLRQPFQNIFLETGISLLQCQLKAWDSQEESERRGFHFVETYGDDPNDDTCAICGDGGDLMCCDSCPSTFHQSCLNIKMLPPGDWYCPNCTCKFCGFADVTESQLSSCCQCERKYHRACMGEADSPFDSDNTYTSFCGRSCKKVFERLQRLLGVKNELESGFSWTLLRRHDEDSDKFSRGLAQRAECNSKLAVALCVMDECFLPIIDRRSRINLIHNVVYNCGSNFNRLNYSGFYTIILEKGDEFVSAASIRIHGTMVAEMPFIGTRQMYRRQGMCRRLLNAIEMVLCSLNVNKLVIPAISELMHTWTVVFGFMPLRESHRQELRFINTLVFPGTDMLQKSLPKRDLMKGAASDNAVVKAMEDDRPQVPNSPHLAGAMGLQNCVSEENATVQIATDIKVTNLALESAEISSGFLERLSLVGEPSDTAHEFVSGIDVADAREIEASKSIGIPNVIDVSLNATAEHVSHSYGEPALAEDTVASESNDLKVEFLVEPLNANSEHVSQMLDDNFTPQDSKNLCQSVDLCCENDAEAAGGGCSMKNAEFDIKSPDCFSGAISIMASAGKSHQYLQVAGQIPLPSVSEPSRSTASFGMNDQASKEPIVAHDISQIAGVGAVEASPSLCLELNSAMSRITEKPFVFLESCFQSDNVDGVEHGAAAIELKPGSPVIGPQPCDGPAKCDSLTLCRISMCHDL